MPDGKWVSKANLQTFWQSIRSKVLPNMIGDTVTTWLTEHVDPVGSAVVVDNTLTIAGAAADAKKTGDEIASLKECFDLAATGDGTVIITLRLDTLTTE